ncbi:MAG: type II toxin-antitoxin system prevent-host-death family antitoxin [Acidobacteria bacterium]|nr:type II toxin-antitoxin system prevent-host-death family antitoxin [Acidobacteriota bacterium]
MKKAGIREARQNLSVLLEEVKKGREIIITDRGKAVARLVPERNETGAEFGSHESTRKRMPRLEPPLSERISDEREDRI